MSLSPQQHLTQLVPWSSKHLLHLPSRTLRPSVPLLPLWPSLSVIFAECPPSLSTGPPRAPWPSPGARAPSPGDHRRCRLRSRGLPASYSHAAPSPERRPHVTSGHLSPGARTATRRLEEDTVASGSCSLSPRPVGSLRPSSPTQLRVAPFVTGDSGRKLRPAPFSLPHIHPGTSARPAKPASGLTLTSDRRLRDQRLAVPVRAQPSLAFRTVSGDRFLPGLRCPHGRPQSASHPVARGRFDAYWGILLPSADEHPPVAPLGTESKLTSFWQEPGASALPGPVRL